MGRRKDGLFEILLKAPWPAGLVAGVVGFVLIRYGIGWTLTRFDAPILVGAGRQLAAGALAPLAWLVLGICWLASGIAWLKRHQRAALLERQTGLDNLRAMGWRAFETLVAEAFRRHGYAVEPTADGADGGVDLFLRQSGRTELVQCKHWSDRRVDVATVREMWGLAAHHRADAVKIVCVGDFTAEAVRFAEGKPIALIGGTKLLELIRGVQASPPAAIDPVPPAEPGRDHTACPRCGARMVRRLGRRTQQAFWGCSTYPGCKGTRSA